MHIFELLHKKLENELPRVHKVRLRSLLTISEAAVSKSKLYLTGLGRELSNTNKESSNIQKVDRLLGNSHLQDECKDIYKAISSEFFNNDKAPWIHVDWTCINSLTNLYVLRASISMKGRSFTIYEECHPKSNDNNHTTHKNFLNQLKSLLPASIKPVIVTDAGFRCPWFKHILKLGWDFVGRLRNNNALYMNGEQEYKLSREYYKDATKLPQYFGKGLLTEKHKTPVNIVLYKGKGKGRHCLNRYKKISKSKMSTQHSISANEPWMLVTSLKEAKLNPNIIVNIYKQRMRIEENIRDTKCNHYGLGLKKSLTKCPKRMGILLLIATIATFAAWLAGMYIKKRGKAADYQAHSAKFKSSLSTVFLGRRVLKKKLYLDYESFKYILINFYKLSSLTKTENYEYVCNS